MSGIITIIGFAGIAGAIERGTSLVPPVIVTMAGIACIIYQLRKEANEEKSSGGNNSNCASYPAGLESIRRRA